MLQKKVRPSTITATPIHETDKDDNKLSFYEINVSASAERIEYNSWREVFHVIPGYYRRPRPPTPTRGI